MSVPAQDLLPFSPALVSRAPESDMRIRHFLAVRPDEATLERIDKVAASLREQQGRYIRPIGKDRYHLSLHGPHPERKGPRDLVARISKAAETVTARGFMVCVDRLSNFGDTTSRHAVVLTTWNEMPGLAILHARLGDALRAAGLKTDSSSFTPHVTLFYRRGLVPERALPPIRWQVRDFVLIRSVIGASRHDEIARWRLAD